jgi:Holliday junction resolvase RusA-like endonuclease
MPIAIQYAPEDFLVKQIFGFDSCVLIESSVDPVSLQSSSERKRRFKTALAEAVRQATDRVFVGDVKVEIDWYVSLKRRYGTHIVADIDNVVKPLLDAVTGPDGIMFDDNQVQQLAISWLDVELENCKMVMRVQASMPDEFITRRGYVFVDFGVDGCWPLPDVKVEVQRMMVKSVAVGLEASARMVQLGIHEDDAAKLKPIQRFYPRSRLSGFEIRLASEFLK